MKEPRGLSPVIRGSLGNAVVQRLEGLYIQLLRKDRRRSPELQRPAIMLSTRIDCSAHALYLCRGLLPDGGPFGRLRD